MKSNEFCRITTLYINLAHKVILSKESQRKCTLFDLLSSLSTHTKYFKNKNKKYI